MTEQEFNEQNAAIETGLRALEGSFSKIRQQPLDLNLVIGHLALLSRMVDTLARQQLSYRVENKQKLVTE